MTYVAQLYHALVPPTQAAAVRVYRIAIDIFERQFSDFQGSECGPEDTVRQQSPGARRHGEADGGGREGEVRVRGPGTQPRRGHAELEAGLAAA